METITIENIPKEYVAKLHRLIREELTSLCDDNCLKNWVRVGNRFITGGLGNRHKETLPPVPLGPNKTRDGRQVEVLALGVNQPGKETHPVIALVKEHNGTDIVCRYATDGVALHHSDWDLVGHLPKPPREVWIWENQQGELAPNTATKIKQSGNTWKHFKEVMP